jgi:hypothetical protein
MSVYIALLARPGARPLAVACAAGHLAYAGITLALVLLVRDAAGSFAAAGLAVGGFAVGAGALAPLRGRLVDRHGGPALVAIGVAYTAALAALLGVAGHGPAWLTVAVATVAGALSPPLIATARSVWPRVAGADLTRAAHAANALLGDAAAVLSPALVGLVAAAAGPAAALAAIAGGPLLGCVLVARLGGSRSNERRVDGRMNIGGAMRFPGVRTIVVAGLPLGVALGALEVGAPAFALEAGQEALVAVPLASFAAGSVLASFWAGHSRRAGGPAGRFVAGAVLLAAALVPAPFATSVAGLAAVLGVAGVGFALLNVGCLELLDVVVPGRNAVEALTWLTSAEGLGVAAGAAAAGALAGHGAAAALAVAALAPAAVAGVALARRGTLGPAGP